MKALSLCFGELTVKLGVVVSSIDELRQKIGELTGMKPDSYSLIDLSNSAILEEDEYFLLMPSNSSIKVQKSGIENQNEQFNHDSMEYLRKIAIKDPSLVPLDSIHLFWKHCDSIGDKTLSNFAKNLMMKNPLVVFSSGSMGEISVSQWEEIVQWENIQCTEYELITALSSWSARQPLNSQILLNLFTKIVPHLRLGQFTFSQLIREIHSYVHFLTYNLLYPFIRNHFLPQPNDFVNNNKKLFEMREFQKENYIVGQLRSNLNQEVIPSAAGIPWSLKIHPLKYEDLPNSYESLVSRKWNYPGCGTEYSHGDNCDLIHYVEAEFDFPVRVTKVILSSPTKGEFEVGGWGFGYIPSCSLSYSKSKNSPFEIIQTFENIIEKDGPIEIDLNGKDIVGKAFRITNADQFALGSFILE